ncbi:MAG: hypothetical protein EHM63_08305 [Actinobacteria bacterium]|nr:MAG: hypothetical protein EHM63_08305 [Actinomycetota bacterium]
MERLDGDSPASLDDAALDGLHEELLGELEQNAMALLRRVMHVRYTGDPYARDELGRLEYDVAAVGKIAGELKTARDELVDRGDRARVARGRSVLLDALGIGTPPKPEHTCRMIVATGVRGTGSCGDGCCGRMK